MTGRRPAPVVRTARLVLRGWTQADLQPWHALHGDPEVVRFLGPGPYHRAATDRIVERFTRHWDEEGFGPWAIEIDQAPAGWPSRFLGFVGLLRVPEDLPVAPAVEIGWRLARPAWGRGVATEAARAALRVGFEDLGLGEVVSFTVHDNTRSRAVMARLGMVRDPRGDFDHPRLPASSPLRRHVLYRLTPAGWAGRAGAPASAAPRSGTPR